MAREVLLAGSTRNLRPTSWSLTQTPMDARPFALLFALSLGAASFPEPTNNQPETIPLLSIAWFLLKKKLGFKALMKVISQDATLVKGSHGRIPEDPLDWPVLIAPAGAALPTQIASTDVYGRIAQGF